MCLNNFFLGKESFQVLLMYICTIQDAAASAALVAGVPLVSIMHAGDWAIVFTPARHYFFTYTTTTYQHQDSV